MGHGSPIQPDHSVFMLQGRTAPHGGSRQRWNNQRYFRQRGPAGVAGQAAYSASKAAVECLTESLADEMASHGIAVNNLTPGWVLTRPNDDYDDDVHKWMRLPEDIAEAAVFLALQTPETMTGQLLSAPDFDQDRGIDRPSVFDRLKS